MCVVSFIGDHYRDKWKEWQPYIPNPNPPLDPWKQIDFSEKVSKAEFDKLKKEVEEMRQLLIKAKIYDEKNNEPNCEIEDKIVFLRKVAELVGVNLDDILKKSGT